MDLEHYVLGTSWDYINSQSKPITPFFFRPRESGKDGLVKATTILTAPIFSALLTVGYALVGLQQYLKSMILENEAEIAVCHKNVRDCAQGFCTFFALTFTASLLNTFDLIASLINEPEGCASAQHEPNMKSI